MKKKIIIAVLMLVATGYVVDLCFSGMNIKSDLTYLGGIMGLLVWFVLVIPFTYVKFIKEKKHEKESVANSVGSNPVVPGGGMHAENRTGDGGHRSRPVRKPKGSAGHNPEDGKGVV